MAFLLSEEEILTARRYLHQAKVLTELRPQVEPSGIAATAHLTLVGRSLYS